MSGLDQIPECSYLFFILKYWFIFFKQINSFTVVQFLDGITSDN